VVSGHCDAMHIELNEAISLLDSWKATGTVLRMHLFRAGQSRELQAKVKDINDAVINIDAHGEAIAIDLDGAEFAAPYANPASN
jgi:hypothetical protein